MVADIGPAPTSSSAATRRAAVIIHASLPPPCGWTNPRPHLGERVNVSKFSFRQSWDNRIELGDPAAPPSVVYQFNPSLPKPCIHPFFTPRGHQLSGFEMSDHVWHRGLWFTIKFINGSNFWEERPPFGIQVSQ